MMMKNKNKNKKMSTRRMKSRNLVRTFPVDTRTIDQIFPSQTLAVAMNHKWGTPVSTLDINTRATA